MSKKQKPAHEPKGQRPQVDIAAVFQTMENFGHWLGGINMRTHYVCNILRGMANRMTYNDADKETWEVASLLYICASYLETEMLRLEYASHEFPGRDGTQMKVWEKFAEKYKKRLEHEEPEVAPEP